MGGALCPCLSWIRVCMRIMPFIWLWYCVCLLNFSVCLSISMYVYLSISIYVYACMSSLSLSLSLSLSICGVDLADQGSRARYRAFQVFCWDSKISLGTLKSVPFPINLGWWKPIILNYALFIRNYYILLWVKVGLTSCWFFSALVYAPLNHKWTYLCQMIPLLLA